VTRQGATHDEAQFEGGDIVRFTYRGDDVIGIVKFNTGIVPSGDCEGSRRYSVALPSGCNHNGYTTKYGPRLTKVGHDDDFDPKFTRTAEVDDIVAGVDADDDTDDDDEDDDGTPAVVTDGGVDNDDTDDDTDDATTTAAVFHRKFRDDDDDRHEVGADLGTGVDFFRDKRDATVSDVFPAAYDFGGRVDIDPTEGVRAPEAAAYDAWQDGRGRDAGSARSMATGDIIVVDGDAYFVDRVGFERVDIDADDHDDFGGDDGDGGDTADRHTPDVFRLSDGDTATFDVTGFDGRVDVTVDDATTTHAPDPAIQETNRVTFTRHDTGESYTAVYIDGLSPTPGESPYPLFKKVTRSDAADREDPDTFGYVAAVN